MRTKQQQAITKRFRNVAWGRLYWADNNPARVRRFDKGTVAIVYWKDSPAVTAYSTIEALVKDIEAEEQWILS